MTILEIITGEPPWGDKKDPAILHDVIIKKAIPNRPEAHIPSESKHGDVLWSLLISCWRFSPEQRLSVNEVMNIVGDASSVLLVA
ncbi:Tyrosine kinase catalytic domain protein [Ceratobasidium sp. AG-Ba]|nr:Tyrosine kinase catalytic domain protein [Ceratobasidium sp. AG-Ba]